MSVSELDTILMRFLSSSVGTSPLNYSLSDTIRIALLQLTATRMLQLKLAANDKKT